MPSTPPCYDVARVRQVIREKRGNVSAMARALGTTYRQLHEWLKTQPALEQEIEEQREWSYKTDHFDPPVDAFREVVAKCDGQITRVAMHYGVAARRIYEYLDEHAGLKEEIDALREEIAGLATFEPDPQIVINRVNELNGNIAALAKTFRTSRQTFQMYVNRHPEVQEALYQSHEEMLDMAETSLYRQVIAGQSWAVCFFLKTQGRKRGYIERGETFNLNVNLDKLSIEQLERLAAGEHPSLVLGAGVRADEGAARGETIDLAATSSTSETGAEEETR